MSQPDKIRVCGKEELENIVNRSRSFSQVLKALSISHRASNNLNILKDKIAEYGLSTEHFGPYKTLYKNQDKLRDIVKKSISISEVLNGMGFRPAGGNYNSVRRWIKDLNIDISHFKGKAHGKLHPSRKIPLEKILVENSSYGSNQLKKRLIKEGLLKEVCSKCDLGPNWNNESLVLQLDHINGVHSDNRMANLRILCPNCHTQTTTFNRKKEIKTKNNCEKCGRIINSRSTRCKECSLELQKIESFKKRKIKDRPSKEQLLKEIEETNYVTVGKKYGVSDNTIRKWTNSPHSS